MQRLLFIGIACVAGFMFARLRNLLPETVGSGQQVWLIVSRTICVAAPYAIGAGALALVFGLSNLGHQLVQGTLLLLMALLGVLVLEMVLIEIVDAAVDLGRRRGFRSVSHAPERVKAQLGFFVRLGMLGLLLALLSDVVSRDRAGLDYRGRFAVQQPRCRYARVLHCRRPGAVAERRRRRHHRACHPCAAERGCPAAFCGSPRCCRSRITAGVLLRWLPPV